MNRLLGMTLFLLAYLPLLLEWLNPERPASPLVKFRTPAYLLLLLLWGISLWKRVVHRRLRQDLIAIAALMAFWIIVREVKWYWVTSPVVTRYLWYAYYIPLLLIPVLCLAIALSLGKQEDEPLPGFMRPIAAISVAFILVVLTNDLHQWIFIFPDGSVWTDQSYSYNTLFYLLISWYYLLGGSSFILIVRKCRLRKGQKLFQLPLFFLALTVLYNIAYITHWPPLDLFARDVTVASCLLIGATLESCIATRLIQHNTHYDQLFDASSLNGEITDRDFQTLYRADITKHHSREMMEDSLQKPILIDQQYLLYGTELRGGYFFWEEDVAQLARVLASLRKVQAELQALSHLRQEEQAQALRRARLEERKKLYQLMGEQVAPQIRDVREWAAMLETEEDLATAQELTCRIAVWGAYLKRRSNLLLLCIKKDTLPSQELILCLEESAHYLRLAGVTCAVHATAEHEVSFVCLVSLFDFYQALLEELWPDLESLMVFLDFPADQCTMRLMFRLRGEGRRTFDPRFNISSDDGIYYAQLTRPRALSYAAARNRRDADAAPEPERAGIA